MPAPDVSIIIPCFNRVDYTVRCLQTLMAATPEDRYEVVIVDNGSDDETPALCSQLDGDVVVIRNERNRGFARACNQGAAAASGRHLLFLNNDTEPRPGWLAPLLTILDDDPEVAAVGAKLLYPDGTIQHGGVALVEAVDRCPLVAMHLHHHQPAGTPAASVRRDLQAVTAAVMAVRRSAFEAVGGFDEGYWNGYEDVDLCLQFGARGWRVVYEPASVVVHHESKSGPERWTKVSDNTRRLLERWVGRVTPDLVLFPDGRTEVVSR